MTEHPITPPPELVQRWYDASRGPRCEHELATQAARWGADQELEECCEWVEHQIGTAEWGAELRRLRRPKPPSLAEQALAELQSHRTELRSLGRGFHSPAINAALKRLQELENNG